MEGGDDNNKNRAVLEDADGTSELLNQNEHEDNNNARIPVEEKEGAEPLADPSKCPVCLHEPFCGVIPFACDHAICLACTDPSVIPRRLQRCPVCRNDTWVFPLEVKAVGSDRERSVIDEIAKIAHVGQRMQNTMRELADSLDDRERARYEEEARKRLDALAIAVKPLTERVDAVAAKIVSESTRRFAVQAGTKLLGLWLMFLLAIASQSLLLSVTLLVLTFSGYVVATEYIAWAEKTHGELLAEGQILGADLKALDKKHRTARRRHNHQEAFQFFVDQEGEFENLRRIPIVAARMRRDGLQSVSNHDPRRANQIVEEI